MDNGTEQTKRRKLVVAIIGQDCAEWLKLCMASVEGIADHIIFINGKNEPNEFNDECYKHFMTYNDFWITDKPDAIINPSLHKHIMINRPFEHDHPGAIGRARNAYLKFIQKHFPGDWCLVLDADEVVDEEFKEVAEILKSDSVEWEIACPKMRHTINTLGVEDVSQPEHHVPGRLFKISNDLYYPETEHATLSSKRLMKAYSPDGSYDGFVIWHLGYSLDMFRLKRKYDNHVKKSEMHSKDFLRNWYLSHLLSRFPVAQFSPTDLPKVVKDYFGIIDDEFYFAGRGLEAKHFIDAKHWKDFFALDDESAVIELGCGLGPRVYALNSYGVDTIGVEISQWAVDHKMHPKVEQGDITKSESLDGYYDLVVCYDVLEHLEHEELDKVLDSIKHGYPNHLLISVPVIGDPNLLNDPTHKIFETRQWWEKHIASYGFEIIPTPQHFLYKEQVIIAKRVFKGAGVAQAGVIE